MRIIEGGSVPVKCWCGEPDEGSVRQARNLASHPAVFSHVALMPDCHKGYGMPIGGVAACEGVLIPNAVGVDIGCGMCAVATNLSSERAADRNAIRKLLDRVRERVPLGEGHAHRKGQSWNGFERYLEATGVSIDRSGFPSGNVPGWLDRGSWDLARRNLGSLGGGNHFIELQEDREGMLWLMLHSGSRNLGYRIARYYHQTALDWNTAGGYRLPDRELAFLEASSFDGIDYIRDMTFAMEYAKENRRRMMRVFRQSAESVFHGISFLREINIHHNYASKEVHFGKEVWVHRKGATSARRGETGIIPGSMGTPSYIVEGLGNPDSFCSCSHGAGRAMGRNEACRSLDPAACDAAMDGIVYSGWKKRKGRRGGVPDLSEAPQAYKNIDTVIREQEDLVRPLVRLTPLGVLKG